MANELGGEEYRVRGKVTDTEGQWYLGSSWTSLIAYASRRPVVRRKKEGGDKVFENDCK